MIVVGNNRKDPDYTFKSLIKSQINIYRNLNLKFILYMQRYFCSILTASRKRSKQVQR